MPHTTSCTNEQKRTVIVTPRTPAGNPAPVEGPIAVEVVSGAGTFEPADAATPTQFKAVSPDGPVTGEDTIYRVSADADLGAGVRTISDLVTLQVTSAEADNFGFADGPVEPK
jgi:hypothetical protein